MKAIFLLVLLCVVGVWCDEEKNLEGDGIYANVLGHSGKIRVSKSEDFDNSDTVTIDFTDLVEQNADGDNIGGNTHRYNSFANTDFTFSAIRPCTYQGLAAQNVSFEIPELETAGTSLVVTLVVFNESGTITNDDESIDVVAGSVKFNVELEGWPFCDEDGTGDHDCDGEVGDHLEFSIELKAPGSKDKKGDEEYEYDGATVVVSRKVKVDGEWVDMEDGYPTVESNGGKDTYTVRFPRADSTILYDPVVTFGNSSSALSASIFSVLLLALIALFGANNAF